ncbi:hypothetical protein F4677DRAFT_445243 [Hypoxylon crocopeplum]|nr:hypothetical protein F4677DRAFT_445243 [Hypoxylon crocopeplum]
MRHLICDYCEQLCSTIEGLRTHRAEYHRASQDLTCPGCEKNFIAAGGWMQHVETGECSRIFPSDVSIGAAQRMETVINNMVKASQTRVGVLPVDLSGPSHMTEDWGAGWKGVDDAQDFDVGRNPDTFPRTARQEFYYGGSKQPDLLTGEGSVDLEQIPGNAWGQKKDLFKEKKKYKAVPLPPDLLKDTAQSEFPGRPTGGRIIDPYDPDFNIALFKDPILETFKCPHKSCNSKFKTRKGLVTHLKSLAHSGQKINCPGCEDTFTTATAWVQHAETVATAKCAIRSMQVYGEALKEISSGALEVDNVNKLINDTVNIIFNEDWAKSKCPVKPKLVPGSAPWIKAKEAEAVSSKGRGGY